MSYNSHMPKGLRFCWHTDCNHIGGSMRRCSLCGVDVARYCAYHYDWALGYLKIHLTELCKVAAAIRASA